MKYTTVQKCDFYLAMDTIKMVKTVTKELFQINAALSVHQKILKRISSQFPQKLSNSFQNFK